MAKKKTPGKSATKGVAAKSKQETKNRTSTAKSRKQMIDDSKKSVSSACQLLAAAQEGDLACVQKLLSEGINTNAKDAKGDSALLRACLWNEVEVAKFLIDNGANINAGNNRKWTPLHYACQQGHLEIVELLVQNANRP